MDLAAAQASKHDLICRKLGLADHAGGRAARRRVRLGLDGDPRRHPLRGRRRRHHDQRGPGGAGPPAGRRGRASATASRSACRTTASSAASSSTRSPRSACPSTSARAARRVLRHPARRPAPARPAAQPRHQLGRRVAARPVVVHRSLRVPRRRADRRRRRACWRWSGPASRCATSSRCASTTPGRCGRGSPTSRRTGTTPSPLVGEARARVWRLYMAGSAVGFEDGGISVHQVLGVVPTEPAPAGCRRPAAGWG